MDPVLAIRRTALEAQAELDRLYAAGAPTAGSALDQLGLRDGLAIVEDFLDHGEAGLALEHLLYMINEPSLQLSPQWRADVAQAARSLGLFHLVRGAIVSPPEDDPELIIPFSRIPMLLMFGPLGILVVVSVLINPAQWKDVPAWAYALLIGGPSLAIVGNIVLPHLSYLQLTPEGLLIKYPFGRRFYPWGEVQNFKVVDGPKTDFVSSGERIAFDFVKDSPRRTLPVKMGAALLGSDMRIMASYRMHPEDLVGVLNEWQQRYGIPIPQMIDPHHAIVQLSDK